MPAGGGILLVGAIADLEHAAEALASLAETRVAPASDGVAILAGFPADLVIADDGAGMTFLSEVATLRPAAVRVLLTANGTAAHHTGEVVTVRKPFDPAALQAVCALALRCAAAERTVRERDCTRDDGIGVGVDEVGEELVSYEGLLTRSPVMFPVLHLLRTVEGAETTVLILGETGTGKELAAQGIHARSRRRGRFVAVNLGAIPDPLKESELFGHVRGAFTGATGSHSGLFAVADGGTIFLDEVAEASPGLQVALLRVLEEGTITAVGADRPRRVDVRVISGTNRNLAELVRLGRFRSDLFYRLHVFPIELPPLRDRREDIFPLANRFLAAGAAALGKHPPGISREARAALEAHPWDGNVRELRNVMERAALLCRGGLIIAADLGLATPRPGSGAGAPTTIAIPPGGASLQQLVREIFLRTLALADGNQSQAARMLGLSESTFRFRLDKLGVAPRRAVGGGSQPAAKAQRAAET